MDLDDVIAIINRKDNWSSKELVKVIKKEDSEKVSIVFYHIRGYECMRDGTKKDYEFNSLKELQEFFEEEDEYGNLVFPEYDKSITDPYKLAETYESKWNALWDDGGGRGWIEFE